MENINLVLWTFNKSEILKFNLENIQRASQVSHSEPSRAWESEQNFVFCVEVYSAVSWKKMFFYVNVKHVDVKQNLSYQLDSDWLLPHRQKNQNWTWNRTDAQNWGGE